MYQAFGCSGRTARPVSHLWRRTQKRTQTATTYFKNTFASPSVHASSTTHSAYEGYINIYFFLCVLRALFTTHIFICCSFQFPVKIFPLFLYIYYTVMYSIKNVKQRKTKFELEIKINYSLHDMQILRSCF